MILINRNETDPYFNIAAEEYVLKEMNEEVFMLWVNDPSVIIGKHQVAAAEANIIFTHNHNIPIIRRISGGGTVYHDGGNLNYSLISHGERGKLVDYEKYSGTVIRALARQAIEGRLVAKSSLVIGDKKFSGNAEHVYRNRVLHHGTLLFNTDLKLLRKCIRPEHRDYVDMSIRSNDSTITNLADHLPQGFTIDDFRKILIDQIIEDFPDIAQYSFTEKDREFIRELAKTKYSTEEWNFSYSPKYELHKTVSLEGKMIRMELRTEKGFIREIQFYRGNDKVWPELVQELVNTLHHPGKIGSKIKKMDFGEEFSKDFHADLLKALF